MDARQTGNIELIDASPPTIHIAELRLPLSGVALGLLALLALVQRFGALAAQPLTPVEALNALATWQVWQAAPLNPVLPTSPLYVTLTALLSQLLGSSDSVMRLVPAAAGTALVLLPWLLRQRLGRGGAIVSGFLLLISPTITAAGRTADGSALALLGLLLLLVTLVRYWDSGDRRWFLFAAVVLGLGLETAPLFYTGLLGLLLVALVQRLAGPALPPPTARPDGALWRQAGLATGGAFLAGNAFFLWYPAGPVLSVWLGNFGGAPDLGVWLAPVLALGRYEPALLTLGAAAILWAAWRNLLLPTLLVYWFTAVLTLLLLQGGEVSNLLPLALPGYLLAGLFAGHLLRGRFDIWSGAATTGLLLLGAILISNLSRFARTGPEALLSFNFLVAVAALLAMIVVTLYVYSWRPRPARQAALLTLLTLLSLYGWGTGRWLSREAANDPRERWVAVGTAGDIRQLAAIAADASGQIAQAERSASLYLGVNSPALRWYLRDFEQLTLGSGPPAVATYDLIVVAAESTARFQNDYLGADFAYEVTAPLPAEPINLQRLLRWWLLHTSELGVEQRRAVLWVRSERIGPGG